MIQAGEESDLAWGDGNWAFLDIGFSNNSRSCGLLVGNEDARCVRFGEALRRIKDWVRLSTSPSNLVIEAPLSVCFDKNGNPKRRKIENQEGKQRYWYVGAGSPVMVAAMYLVRALDDSKPRVPVRIYEGFVSFKKGGGASRHESDAEALRAIVKNPMDGQIYSAVDLKEDSSDILKSAFDVLGLNCGIPLVMRPSN